MFGIIFSICISIGIPLFALIYACVKRHYIPFFLGVLAFVISQLLFRLPLLDYLQSHSTTYSMLSIMNPVLFAIAIGLSAGIVEELARYIMMRFFMKQRSFQAGFLFGTGHGGIEAVWFVGISAISMLFSPLATFYNIDFLIGGTERFFALMLHIGLSIIVLHGVIQRKFLFVVLAIFIHGFIDTLIGIFPLIFESTNHVLIASEVSLAVTALVVISYSFLLKRRNMFS
ncbi:YhfC family glutamic-type intramembrane protease [Ornithinibacillus halotolerans]|uniref:CAAX amino protease n=1 Tax=Ornithinibacillus halotolerans TaxID=1274357 RepID=A0A916SA73_9BACI|nr:YhfC family glutamic-type intramembrane protease [Ornithinibacillus halotolerans]GGA91117.1 CAAX amino protease [Ornithinibacillus halotolerans]